MIRLVEAEFLKLRTTQVWFWLLLAAVAISALLVIGPIASGDVHNGRDVADMFGSAALAYVVLFVLGVLGVTTEFRYQTITPTVLQTPSRWALVTAKMITYALTGVAFAVVCLAVQLAIAVPWLSADGVDYSLGSDGIPHALIGVFVVLALFGIVGLGIGALIRNQIVAVSIGVIFLLVLENIFLAIPGVKHVYPYLPGGAARAIADVTARDDTVNGVRLLPVGGGVIMLLLWAFVPAIVGAAFSMNRDIT
ncbi:MAG TPA: ABC transporter permease [Jatrophihabitans sp.]|jgi:phage tail protein X|nr:ABC transporter permease [Jatrophihabitans sp.]